MKHDIAKLMEFDKVNYQRAKRLIKEFGDYDSVMSAPYQRLLEVHYVGEETAKSIYESEDYNPNSLLD